MGLWKLTFKMAVGLGSGILGGGGAGDGGGGGCDIESVSYAGLERI